MNLEKHISHLLYDHDCVIIPDFGGFVTSYQPASVHPVHHTFSPPSKKVAFNVRLKNNDGLLANELVKTEQLSYRQAVEEIRNFVDGASRKLNTEHHILLEKIGSFRLDPEKNIRFSQDLNVNYLSDSFGLTTFQSVPVKRESALRERITERQKTVKPESSSKKRGLLWKAALVLPAVGLFAWVSMNTFRTYQDKIQFSNLNPFADTGRTSEMVRQNIPSEQKKSVALFTPLDEAEKFDLYLKNIPDEVAYPHRVSELPEIPNVNAEDKTEPIKATIPSASNNGNKYFIVAGCFGVEENAVDLVETLRISGFASATVIGKTKGLTVVSYAGFGNFNEATEQLQHIRKTHNKEAWVLTR